MPDDDAKESWELFAFILPDLYSSLEKHNRKQDRSILKKILEKLMDEEVKNDKSEHHIKITGAIVDSFPKLFE